MSPLHLFFLLLCIVYLSPDTNAQERSLWTNPRASTVRDLFVFSTPLSNPETLEFDAESKYALEIGSAWSNSDNRKPGSYVFDLETRLIETALAIRLSDAVAVSIRLPIIWRGGGILDESIYQWHEIFGLEQGPRSGSTGRDDDFRIEARSDEGELIALQRRGFGVGNAQVQYVYRPRQDVDGSFSELQAGFLAPTITREYGVEGVGLWLAASEVLRFYEAYWELSARYLYLSQPELGPFRLYEHHLSSRLGLYYPTRLFDTSVSLYTAFQYHSAVLKNVNFFPDFQLYWDLGLRTSLTNNTTADLILRENPAPDTGSADVSLYLLFSFAF